VAQPPQLKHLSFLCQFFADWHWPGKMSGIRREVSCGSGCNRGKQTQEKVCFSGHDGGKWVWWNTSGCRKDPYACLPGNRGLGQQLAAARGWSGSQWSCLEQLWTRESGWNHLAVNPSSGACGIPQALPCSKMASHGGDYRTNPSTQIRWGLDYIGGRYGSPCGAWSFWQSHNWY
ncbi:MAG: transglycosylase SLT domain-containing protein, partial [Myxococcales bacterium]|nr:transglycosylase SLT domain-containing protein [Myxococcales bacterium]